MVPQTKKRSPANSARTNLIIAGVIHALLAGVVIFFAAREGFLGKQIKKIAVEMVKEKQPEKPKEPEKPKPEPPKIEPPKIAQAPKIEEPRMATPPPPVAAGSPVSSWSAVGTNIIGDGTVKTFQQPTSSTGAFYSVTVH